jgi:hypothetical protein
MKHQISLVGGQLLPVYVGIKEFMPDKLHLIASSDSIMKVAVLKSCSVNISIQEYICDPFDFFSIKSVCEKIIDSIDKSDEITFNLTGGTKIMVLAAQAILFEKQLQGFYINQDDSYLLLPSYIKTPIQNEITIKEFFDLSGHHIYSAKHLSDYTPGDFITASSIENFANFDKRYSIITKFFRNKFKNNLNHPFPRQGKEVINNVIEVSWSIDEINAIQSGVPFFYSKAPNAIDLFFNAAWWELIVAETISKWSKVKELLIKCELPFISDSQSMKNEIDVLINLGKKLIFVECKSGNILQEDINKMRIIKQTYGGVISKSILVSRFNPNTKILEKCKELDIEVFSCFNNNMRVNFLNALVPMLESLDKKPTV